MEHKINKSKIERRVKSKRNNLLIETIIFLKRTNPYIARRLAMPKRKWAAVNLKEIEGIKGDVLVTGKILSAGELSSKKKIVAWSFSSKALLKIKESNCDAVLIIDEIKKNPELKELVLIK
jgi:ribosomal protein L18E